MLEGGKEYEIYRNSKKVDELGRVVLPIELRRTLDIAEKDALEICRRFYHYIEEIRTGMYILRRCQDVTSYKGKNICPACMKELGK